MNDEIGVKAEAADAGYADPQATKEISLGECICPGRPHAQGDTAVVRTSAGWGELKSAWQAGKFMRPDGSVYLDEAYGDAVAIARFTKSWSLLTRNGHGKSVPLPLTLSSITILPEGHFEALKTHVDALLEGKGRLPNASSGRSVDSSPATASSNRRKTRA